MTIWGMTLKYGNNSIYNKLGHDVYIFLDKAKYSSDFLSDYEFIKQNIKSQSKNWQLSDYSPLILPLVKYYENSLWWIMENLDIFAQVNKNKKPYSLRQFIDQKESEIEDYIINMVENRVLGKRICRKLFIAIDEYEQRNEVVHSGKLIRFSEMDNYDLLLIKLKELVKCLFDNSLIKK